MFNSLTKKRWLILMASCMINLCLGSIYAWSVFAAPMAEHIGNLTGVSLGSGDLAIVYTVANSVGPITMISGGWVNDRFGPRKVILTGGLMFAAGMILSGFATSVAFLIMSYGLLSGLGLGMAYGCTISSCVKFFPDKRGLVGGITTAVYGMGSVILPPVVTAIVRTFDVPTAFKGIGVTFAVIVAVCAQLIQKCPDDFAPEGWSPPAGSPSVSRTSKDWRGMLASPVFYVMICLLTCGAFSGMMIISQASAVAQTVAGLSALAASTAVSVLALFNTAGRIAAGYLSDRIGRVNTLTLACLFSIGGLLLLYFSSRGNPVSFFVGVSVVGASFGSFMGVFPGFTADQFGAKNNSVNYGIMFIGFALAGFFGPTAMNGIFQSSGSYKKAFLVACGLSLCGLFLTVVYRLISRKFASEKVPASQIAAKNG